RDQRHAGLHRDFHYRSNAWRARRRGDGPQDVDNTWHRRRGDCPRLRGGCDRRNGIDRGCADRCAGRRHLPGRRRTSGSTARIVRHLRRHGAGARRATVRAVCASPAAENRTRWARAQLVGGLLFLIAAAAAPVLPEWVASLVTIAFANALVVLGLVVLWRAGLVSFGQALYYCIGAYTVALIARWTGFTDAIALVLLGGIGAGLVEALVG